VSKFTNHLGLILYEDHDGRPVLRNGRVTQWFVDPPLTYMVGGEDSGERISVPAFNPVGLTELEILGALASGQAFVTDLGSIPQIAWSLGFTPSGPEAKAFVLHDYGYVRKGVAIGHRYGADGHLTPVNYSRSQVDGLLLEAMGVLGCDPHKSRLIYDAVRLGGAHAWGS
jgi:hypothetical protein